MLFAEGKRPTADAIRKFATKQEDLIVSYDPRQVVPIRGSLLGDAAGRQSNSAGGREWAELLHQGLAFDLEGLAPGEGVSTPHFDHRFDIDEGLSVGDLEAVHLVPGEHLAGAGSSLPVMRAMLGLACDFIRAFDTIEAVVWVPSASAIGRRYFESVVSAWLDGGPFPALGITAFRPAEGGALESVGLGYWIGRELRIVPPTSEDRVEATWLGIRLINLLVMRGGLQQEEAHIAPDGAPLLLRPSADGRYIVASRE